uniref:RAP domain-containing protein n=1 Tax=Chromera velia CCMP2878 TaxID=1169474 RepID=A0A0G4I6Q7_9ALVE|eukprot:Cvel_11473.t1-p1 / transcript=Cvel_11473.t1 / gene=Cvel_11473 / organism=Chromera_velia_CCMP2878 / gene_product=hypothetical protein / transcript_product=hypothetical protein / location=Cvel_scaffold722:40249-44697(+) / protein_length=601 / sequence_SO=supercontig / SO=protein_coding / is_pseudo=false
MKMEQKSQWNAYCQMAETAIDAMTGTHIAKIAKSLSSVRYKKYRLATALNKRCLRVLREIPPADLCLFVAHMARLDCLDVATAAAVAAVVRGERPELLAELQMRDIARLLVGFRNVRLRDESFLLLVTEELGRRIDRVEVLRSHYQNRDSGNEVEKRGDRGSCTDGAAGRSEYVDELADVGWSIPGLDPPSASGEVGAGGAVEGCGERLVENADMNMTLDEKRDREGDAASSDRNLSDVDLEFVEKDVGAVVSVLYSFAHLDVGREESARLASMLLPSKIWGLTAMELLDFLFAVAMQDLDSDAVTDAVREALVALQRSGAGPLCSAASPEGGRGERARRGGLSEEVAKVEISRMTTLRHALSSGACAASERLDLVRAFADTEGKDTRQGGHQRERRGASLRKHSSDKRERVPSSDGSTTFGESVSSDWRGPLVDLLSSCSDHQREVDVLISSLQKSVAGGLRRMREPFDAESVIGPFVVDFALTKRKIVVEVDGHSHFFALSKRLTPKSEFKSRILRALGWKVVRIPWWEVKKRDRPQAEGLVRQEVMRASEERELEEETKRTAAFQIQYGLPGKKITRKMGYEEAGVRVPISRGLRYCE